ncbi:VOC family protein [Nocardiopsis eucommiae]|uniref:VOC family protein n=1 Tax=Nocardiopsis eucommiae TaxID=2831970 RepID=A0A975L8G7_9ACTN|nr:VOC family protein [Nocardiopsis eucommiae]
MLTQIAIHAVTVLDQDEALDFYVGKLGFEVGDDVDMGFMRWLTITLPADPDRHILLEVPSEDEDGARVRELLTKGALGVAAIINTDDCQATYDTLRSRGVTFTEEPTQQPYGIDCALRDPFGNHLRITQPTPMQEITEEDLRRWRGEE